MKRFTYLELIIRQPASEEDAITRFREKVTNQFRLRILGEPLIYWQDHLFEKRPDAIVKARVAK
jgi:hypothetical protein